MGDGETAARGGARRYHSPRRGRCSRRRSRAPTQALLPQQRDYVALTVPGDLLDIYDEVGTPASQRRLPDGGLPVAEVTRWIELAPRYGLRIVGPPIPEEAP